MKKILSIACLFFALIGSSVYAQSNLTWVVKDQIDDNTFKTRVEFHIAVEGLTNQKEAEAFCEKMKTNPELESCQLTGKDVDNSYLITFKMKKNNDAMYYIGWAQKLGVGYIAAKGERKSTMEWAKGERK